MTNVKDFQQLFDSINPEIYEKLKRAVEIGKWADGERLSRELRANCMQAVIAYEHKHLSPEERSGYVPPKVKKEPCGTDKSQGAISEPDDKPLKWT
jgi:uncharacterized protein YeaC (DUF1315 family)|tara:strand:+ start:5166 stop:5453 length:288 start_codon:yes stop_codon:yes gene_type:complete